MDYARAKAYAKINLSLDITGSEGGYHTVDSVVTSIDLYDLITVRKRKKDKLVSVLMHGMGSEDIPHEKNNAVRAAEKFVEEFGCCGADIEIYKNIPMGAGLGGSSADAAGVLIALKNLFGIDDEQKIKAIADGVGSDCGYMLYGGYARLTGRGERTELIESNLKLDLLLLIPQSGVSTAECYGAYDRINCRRKNSSAQAYEAVINGDKAALGKAMDNALFPAAYSLNGDVGEAVESLKAFDPLGVNMTGSGSCVYALFENGELTRYAESRYKGKFLKIRAKTYLPDREKLWRKKD